MQKHKKSGKKSRVRAKMKEQLKRKKRPEIERKYLTIFSPQRLPSRGAYTDDESLEQPSALKYVPTTATPHAEAYDPK